MAKIRKTTSFLNLVQLVFIALMSILFIHKAFAQDGWNPDSLASTNLPDRQASDILLTFIDWAITIIGLLGVIVFIYGGFVYLTAQGENSKLEQAKKIILYGIVGIAVAVLGFVAVKTVDNILRGNVSTGSAATGTGATANIASPGDNSKSSELPITASNMPSTENGLPGGGGGGNGNFATGEIASKDSTSVTVKTRDGGTKIVSLSDSTTVSKSVKGTISDLAVGTKIMVNGTSDSNGSISAQNIRINPVSFGAMRGGGSNGSGFSGGNGQQGTPQGKLGRNGNDNFPEKPQGGFGGNDNQGRDRGGFAFGEITANNGNSITIKDNDGTSKVVNISDSTLISKTENISASDLTNGEQIFASGSDGQDSFTAQEIQVR